MKSRIPTLSDLVALCRELNARDARYVVCGGFAIRMAGYLRTTGHIDLVIDTALENEAKVYQSLEIFPDKAVLELRPGEVADEVVVDLMRAAAGIEYAEAAREVIGHEIEGVEIPFASPLLPWRMKRHTHREKDRTDLFFLRQLFEAEGITPPE